MSLRLYNTRTRSVESFEPLAPPRVRIYVCGLTPSAEAHVGHARTYLFFDVLRRYLTHRGYAVEYVQNVTDIDDRSIATARESGENWHDIVMRHYRSFKASMKKLGVLAIEPALEPYATDYVAHIVRMIGELVERGYAYPAKDGVYYRVSKFPDYGKLSNRNVLELRSGARIEVDEFKDDPLDFALWKFAKAGEPSWESPWGAGRPGWHIECSAMARELLGEHFDIHGGGADLIFPHHENEIAQSTPLMNDASVPMAKYWVHGGLLLFDNKKMSKSLGNFEPLSALLERHDPQAIRLLFLQTGYSKVMNFTEESIGAAQSALDKLRENYRELVKGSGGLPNRPVSAAGLPDGALSPKMEAALDDDLNTAAALRELLSFSAGSSALRDGGSAEAASAVLTELTYWATVLGLAPNDAWTSAKMLDLPGDFLERLQRELRGELSLDGTSPAGAIERIIAARNAARARKDFAASDRLRDALIASGTALKDSKEGTTWTVAG